MRHMHTRTPHKLALTGTLLLATTMLAAGQTGANLRQTLKGNAMSIAVNRFTLDLYAQLGARPGNVFASPFSAHTALAMSIAGARGTTAAQMAKVMHLAEHGPTIHHALGQLVAELTAATGDGCELRIANGLWAQQGFRFLPSYLEILRTGYGAEPNQVDFVDLPEPARAKINAWVEEQTRERIKDLVPSDMITRDTRLFLVNAVYFLGSWKQPFATHQTRPGPFTRADGEIKTIPLMRQTGRFLYAEAPDMQVLEMPYVGERLAMTILLPRRHDGLAELETRLSVENLARWLDGGRAREVRTILPKFRLDATFSLAQPLRAMGMSDAFTAAADFSGMTGQRDLFISGVVHKAFVEVDEKGTEAAAATGIGMSITSMPTEAPPLFQADRPFVFLIRDRASGAILFIGRLAEPQ